jgi:MoxR-like ATPase
MRTRLGYPNAADEARVLDLRPANYFLPQMEPVLHRDDVVALQKQVDSVRVDRALLDYIIALATASRNHEELQVGLSPRGSLALAQAARATAAMAGRDYAIPEDILRNVQAVCAHRIIAKNYLRDGDAEATGRILRSIVESIKSPA